MSWVASIVGIAGAAASVYSSVKKSGSKAKASSTNAVTPADWSDLSGGEDMWGEFVSNWAGGDTARINNAKSKLTPDQQADINSMDSTYDRVQTDMEWHHKEWLRKGYGEDAWANHPQVKIWKGWLSDIDNKRIEKYPEIYGPNADATTPKSMKEMLGEDNAFQKDASQTALDSNTQTRNKYLADVGSATDKYQTALASPAMTTPFSFDGKKMGILTRAQQKVGRENYDTDFANATLAGSIGEKEAGDKLQHNVLYTPNSADIQYMDKLWPMLMQMQGFRYQTPTTTETATGGYDKTLADRVGGAATGINQIATALGDIFKKPSNTNVVAGSSDLDKYFNF